MKFRVFKAQTYAFFSSSQARRVCAVYWTGRRPRWMNCWDDGGADVLGGEQQASQ